MILIDANILLHAYNSSSERHEVARGWLQEVFTKPEPVGLSWVTLLAFLRVSTNPRAFVYPLVAAEAVAIVTEWLEQPSVVILAPGERHWPILGNLLVTAQAQGPLVTDAHLAALAIEHGATLATTDRDFARFPGLRTVNPLEPGRPVAVKGTADLVGVCSSLPRFLPSIPPSRF